MSGVENLVAAYCMVAAKGASEQARTTAWLPVVRMARNEGEVFSACWLLGTAATIMFKQHVGTIVHPVFTRGQVAGPDTPVEPEEAPPELVAGGRFIQACAVGDVDQGLAIWAAVPKDMDALVEVSEVIRAIADNLMSRAFAEAMRQTVQRSRT